MRGTSGPSGKCGWYWRHFFRTWVRVGGRKRKPCCFVLRTVAVVGPPLIVLMGIHTMPLTLLVLVYVGPAETLDSV